MQLMSCKKPFKVQHIELGCVELDILVKKGEGGIFRASLPTDIVFKWTIFELQDKHNSTTR